MNAILVPQAATGHETARTPSTWNPHPAADASSTKDLVRIRDARRHTYTVLIVDDESDIAESFQDCIERGLPDVRVLTALTGLEALYILEQEPIDLIVTDYRMPGMDGFELLSRVKRVAPAVHRIVVSAYTPEVTPWISNQHHLTNVLTKPVDPEELIQAVHDTLQSDR